MSYNKVLPMIVAAAAIGCAVGVHAAPSSHQVDPAEVFTVRVKFANRDLADPAGAARLLRRIHMAASEVCGFEPSISDMGMQPIYHRCFDKAVNDAVDRLGAPLVSALNGGNRSAVMASNVH